MARHYSVREFFRQMPNALLARLFHQRGLFQNLDFTNMKETKPDELFDAWLALPDGDRKTMDSVLQEIFELSCEKGFHAIIDELRWQLQNEPDKLANLIETLSTQPNHYYRAIVTYLDYPECWKGAIHFHYADTLNYWRKRKQMGHSSAGVDKASTNQLANLIRCYFHRYEGRGNNCVVEVFRRGDLDYFFAYPEDYSQQSIEWINGEFGRRPHNPAFEIVYIYSQKDGTLDLNFNGAHKSVEPLQGMFATAILKLDQLPPNHKDHRIYDLNSLFNKNFNFTYPVGSGIENVAVKKIRFSSRINKGDRITIEADAADDPTAVYSQLEKIGKSIPLHLYNITQVELSVSVSTEANKPPKTVSIRISYPNSCSLKYDEVGLKLRAMLEASGIEPKEPALDADIKELAEA